MRRGHWGIPGNLVSRGHWCKRLDTLHRYVIISSSFQMAGLPPVEYVEDSKLIFWVYKAILFQFNLLVSIPTYVYMEICQMRATKQLRHHAPTNSVWIVWSLAKGEASCVATRWDCKSIKSFHPWPAKAILRRQLDTYLTGHVNLGKI